MSSRSMRIALAIGLAVLALVGGVVVSLAKTGRTHVVAYFDNSNGVFPGDEVRILGVPVGKIDTIEPQPDRAKVTFWLDDKYPVPADVKAVILSPQLITARAIQLTPAYTGGPRLADNAVIPEERTAVPVEWDDVRQQLEKLTQSLQPTQPGGVSPLGALVNTAADNLRGQGANIRDTIMKLSQAFSALGDHSNDIFSTIKNLSVLVSALQSSTDVMAQLNQNLATVTALLADDPNKIGQAVNDINRAAADVQKFVAENRESLGTTAGKLSGITKAVSDSLDDIKQTLHVAPNSFQNFVNIYEPAQGALSGMFAIPNFANPISFLCGAIQAASRLGAEQSAKLCVQYLAPIIKNRQYNFPPIGENLLVGAPARPNELTYSEDWMRPDYRPAPAPGGEALPAEAPQPPQDAPPTTSEPPLPAAAGSPPAQEAPPAPPGPAAGLRDLMVPSGAGS
jgi:phospholipid/cholesterol/gamma-HCH transport system substrate-binding protein